MVRLIQMKWKGMVSHHGYMTMRSRLIRPKTTQAASTMPLRWARIQRDKPGSQDAAGSCGVESGRASRSASDELIALTPHGLDQVEAELGAQPPDAGVDDVRARIDVVAPDGGEQPALGHRFPGVLHEFAQQQELQLRERHRPVPDIRDHMADVEGHAAGPDNLAGGRRIGTQP